MFADLFAARMPPQRSAPRRRLGAWCCSDSTACSDRVFRWRPSSGTPAGRSPSAHSTTTPPGFVHTILVSMRARLALFRASPARSSRPRYRGAASEAKLLPAAAACDWSSTPLYEAVVTQDTVTLSPHRRASDGLVRDTDAAKKSHILVAFLRAVTGARIERLPGTAVEGSVRTGRTARPSRVLIDELAADVSRCLRGAGMGRELDGHVQQPGCRGRALCGRARLNVPRTCTTVNAS